MILSSVIIILGEVLELSILGSLFLALSFRLKMSRHWIAYAVIAGIACGILYAISFDTASQWFDGFGQEVINAGILIGIYLSLLLFNATIFINDKKPGTMKIIRWAMISGMVLAITRDGSEIFLYLSGFILSGESITPILTGSILGAGIGLSFGILIYYLFTNMTQDRARYVGYTLLLFVAAGMLSQAVRLLIQIDWLPAQNIVWDTSDWLDESSITGRLLYTLIGYEATPTPIEIQCYIAAIVCILVATIFARYSASKDRSGRLNAPE
ncbi:MAG TPA: iron permease [Gammaproteobacteria bacterium]|nr:iron permease [Gammaproteobacteria bacterium]